MPAAILLVFPPARFPGYYDSGQRAMEAMAQHAALIAEDFAKKLTVLHRPTKDVQALLTIAALFREIEGCKHTAYACLRVAGAAHLESLSIIDELPPDDQEYILHALVAFPGNPAVAAFYNTFIERTKGTRLRKAAKQYLSRI